MLFHERRKQGQRRATSGVDVARTLDPVDLSLHLRDMIVELEGEHRAVALVVKGGGCGERQQAALVIDGDDKSLEDFVADEPADREAFNLLEALHRIRRKQLVRQGDIPQLQHVHLDEPDVLGLFAHPPSLKRALRLEPKLFRKRRREDVRTPGVAEECKRALTVQFHLHIDVIVRQLEWSGSRRLAPFESEVRRGRRRLAKEAVVNRHVELDLFEGSELVVLLLAIGGSLLEGQLHPTRRSVIGEVGGASLNRGFLQDRKSTRLNSSHITI